MDSDPVTKREQKEAKIRSELKRYGTDVEKNDADTLGDGDQSYLGHLPFQHRQYYRNLWASGGDFMTQVRGGGLTTFANMCLYGQYEGVETKLKLAAVVSPTKPSPALLTLLETRYTSMRVSPLLMMVSITKNMTEELREKQLKVVEVLLKYGARPDAKDVVGKTVCHYGMGMMANDLTLKAGEYCIQAYRSSYLFGKLVELHSLKNEAMNGKRGWDRGYVTSTGRRAIYLPDRNDQIGVKPQNLRLVGEPDVDTSERAMLADIQDRLGNVCLHEVITSNRSDCAKLLLNKYNARVDIADADGCSAFSLCSHTSMCLQWEVAELVRRAGTRYAREEKREKVRTCAVCSKEAKFKCAACNAVSYCSKACQTHHWKKGTHKADCKKNQKESGGIVLERPDVQLPEDYSFFSIESKSGKSFMSKGFNKPSYVGCDEPFYIKVQCQPTVDGHLLIYDKSRECEFLLPTKAPGHLELFLKTKEQKATFGTKSYYKATFSRDDKLTVYPISSTMKTW